MKHKIIYIALLSIILTQESFSQLNLQWERKTNGNNSGMMVNDSNNNVILLVMDGNDMKTIKYSPTGQLIWSRKFVSQYGNCLPKAIEVDPRGNVYISGGQFLFTTVKYDSNGNLKWARYFLESIQSEVYDMAVDSLGNVYVTGTGWYFRLKPLTVKYDTEGEFQWSRFYNLTEQVGSTYSNSLDKDRNVFTTGHLGDSCITIKYNSDGTLLWSKFIHKSQGNSIAIDNQQNVIIGGSSIDDSGIKKILFSKYSNSGDSLWSKTYSFFRDTINVDQYISSISIDKENSIYGCGSARGNGSGNSRRAIVVKYNPMGEMLWNYEYSDTVSTFVFKVSEFYKGVIDKQGNYYVMGLKNIYNHPPQFDYTDILSIKFSPTGNILWKIDKNLLINQRVFGKDIVVDKNFNVTTIEWNIKNDTFTVSNYSQVVNINQINDIIPESIELYQNYPNPFNGTTIIRFSVSKSDNLKLEIYDLQGRKIETLLNRKLNSGTYEIQYNSKNLSSGIYYYKITSGNISMTKKLVLIK